MKLTVKQLRSIIKEEVQAALRTEVEEDEEVVRCPRCKGEGHVIVDETFYPCDPCDGEGEMSPQEYEKIFNHPPSPKEYIG